MRFQCPVCKGIVSVEDSEMGSSVQCGHCNKQVTVPSSRTASGSVIGDFIILHELGRGGMGVVYLAHQISLDRPAAVKILADNYARNSEFVVGFIKEARAAAKLNHPNIVQAYAVGDDDGIFYFAMEHIDGETMKDILKQKTKLSVDQAIDITRQIAEALDYAWQEEKLVHRDIKPDNIMLTSSGRAKLADLGLAKVGNENSQSEGDEVMGTPQYISPEQLTGDPLDNRTDIYCLGATFYHFLTGRFPYNGSSTDEIARQHVEGTLIPPDQVDPNIPEAVSQVVVKMMAKDPAQRYQTAGQLAEDLALIKRGQSPSIASPSSSLQAQTANTAGNKTAAPKLHIPGKTLKAADAQTSGKGAPKLNVPGLKSRINVASGAAGSPAPAAQPPVRKVTPKLVKKVNPPAPVAPPSQDPAVSASPESSNVKPKKKKKEQQSGGSPLVKIIVGVIVLLVIGAGGAFAYFKFVKKQDPVNLIGQVKEVIKKKASEPEPSEFMKAAGPLIKKLRSPENADPAANAKACYDFLRKRIMPETDEEKEFQREITAFFVQHDENATEEARIAAISKYEAEQERKRLAAEAAAKAKMEAEHQARIRAAERKVVEAEQQRLAAEQRRLQARKDSFKRQMAALEQKMVLDLVRYGDKHDAEGLKKILDNNIDIRVKMNKPDYLSHAEFNQYTSALISRAKFLRKNMDSAWEWEEIFTNGDPRLKGLAIELNFNICSLTRISNGVIYASAGSKNYSAPVDKLLNNKKFRQFAIQAATKLQKKDTLPFYFFWRGAYRNAYEVSLEASPRGRSLYSAFVSSYLRVAWQNPGIKAQLVKKFRGVPEYDRLNPPPRRPAPPRPAAKKPAPRKPAPKKPAPKKKK